MFLLSIKVGKMERMHDRRGEGEWVSSSTIRHLATDTEYRDGVEQLQTTGHCDFLRICSELAESMGQWEVLWRHETNAGQTQALGGQNVS